MTCLQVVKWRISCATAYYTITHCVNSGVVPENAVLAINTRLMTFVPSSSRAHSHFASNVADGSQRFRGFVCQMSVNGIRADGVVGTHR